MKRHLLFERELSDIPNKNKNGKCYEVALQYMMAHAKDKSLRLCHGLPTGQGEIEGIVYNHAWVEKGNKVIDETIPIELPKTLYYNLGRIRERDVYRYTYEEMSHKVTEFHTYGPWEKKLIANKF